MQNLSLFAEAEKMEFSNGASAPITWLVEFVDGKESKGTVVQIAPGYFRLETYGGELNQEKTYYFEENKVVKIRPM